MSGTSEAAALNSPVMNNTGASQPQTEQQLQVTWPQYPSLPDGSVMITPTGNTMNTRKRGRPRKYGPDGNMNILASPQQPVSMLQQQQQQQQAFSSAAPPPAVQTEANPAVDGSASPSKKSRGRPRGSKNKKQRQEAASASASGSNGGFVPHVVNVEPGEDVASKIMSICQNGPRAVCVLSANGTISTVTLHQAATSGGTATYEGRFDILSLSGSFLLTEVSGQKSRKGGLSVALAGPDGSVLGGSVAGLLVAASPAQVIVGSFLPDGQKEASTSYGDPSSIPYKVNAGGAAGASSSPSRGTLSESSGGGASPYHMSSAGFNNIPQGMAGLPWKS
ncbi:hypothetical protein ACS0TY_013685 [Phlomoides rotata]